MAISRCIRSVNENKLLKDNPDSKFRSLICRLLNEQILHHLFSQLAGAVDKERRNIYEPHGAMVSEATLTDVSKRLEPLEALKFKLAIDLGVLGKDEDALLATM
mmetsp:Transcript_32794/g.76958  ORF Transcript_32794/g.76958 Transcript_32794/m.76958 type:complete len:104 (+) Transcript_32794:258-569(+)